MKSVIRIVLVSIICAMGTVALAGRGGRSHKPLTFNWPTEGGNVQHTGLSPLTGPVQGCLRWVLETSAPVVSAAVTGMDDMLYIACMDGHLYALNSMGLNQWDRDFGIQPCGAPAVDAFGAVYIAMRNGIVYGLEPTGEVSWLFNCGLPICSSPLLSANGYLYIGTQTGILLALDTNPDSGQSYPDGREVWRFSVPGPANLPAAFLAPPAMGNDGMLYAGAVYDPNLYALDAETGKVLWRCTFDTGSWPMVSPVVAGDGTIYQVLLNESHLYALAPENGHIRWRLDLQSTIDQEITTEGWTPPVLGPDGTIYAAMDDATLRAVDPNGTIMWIKPLADDGALTLTVDKIGRVFAACDTGSLHVIDSNGTELARMEVDQQLNHPVIFSDRVLALCDAGERTALDPLRVNKVLVISETGCEGQEFLLDVP